MKKEYDNLFLFIYTSVCLSLIFTKMTMYFFSDYLVFILSEISKLKLEEWRSIAIILYGAIGLLLGYWYFSKKISFERKNLKDDRARRRLSFLYDEFCKGDELINKIFDKDISDESELKQVRVKIDRIFQSINIYLDNNETLLGFTGGEIKSLLKVHSFIVNNHQLFKAELRFIKKDDLSVEYEKYLDIILDARSICLQKEELI